MSQISITEHKETYKMHGLKLAATVNFMVNKIKLEVIEPIQESVYIPLKKYEDFEGNMKEFVESLLNVNHKYYKA